MDVELKPCPFCGGAASVQRSGGSDERSGYNFTVSVWCTSCGVKLTRQSDHDKNGWCNEPESSVTLRVTDAWNNRHGAGDAEDAARYRWLKARSWGGSGAYYFQGPPYREGMTLDAAIDAARAGERG